MEFGQTLRLNGFAPGIGDYWRSAERLDRGTPMESDRGGGSQRAPGVEVMT